MVSTNIPLFPLNSVLFPGGTLPLRIFEIRYIDMISYCMRNHCGFGVCLIREGEEIGRAALTYDIGTLVEIVDFDRSEEGLLHIEVVGRQRFKIFSREVQPDQLITADVEFIPNEPHQELPKDYDRLPDILEQFIKHLGNLYKITESDYQNATWISYRLSELLPMLFTQRQYLLELTDPIQRLEGIGNILTALDIRY